MQLRREKPPPATNRRADGPGQQQFQKSVAIQLSPSAIGHGVADVDKDKKDKGNKGDKGADTKQPPADRVHSPNTNKGSLWRSIRIGVTLLSFTIVATFIIDRLGRRILLLTYTKSIVASAADTGPT